MGDRHTSKRHKSKRKYLEEKSSCTSSSSSYASSDSEDSVDKRSSRHRHREEKHKKGSKREKDKIERARRHLERKRREKRKRRKERKPVKRKRDSDSNDSYSSDDDNSESPTTQKNPELILGYIMENFPDVLGDLEKLLQMIDAGQAVDPSGIPNRTLVKSLKNLFVSLNLKENGSGVFFLPSQIRPTLETVGPAIALHLKHRGDEVLHPESPSHMKSLNADLDRKETSDLADETRSTDALVREESSAPRRRVIGPEMPSSELLAAAAKLTEAEAQLRDAEIEADDDLFIGPPPPAVVAEAASANEAERFEEVTRIMGAEVGTPYDVLGVNHKMLNDNIKKRYWKLSLMVHPDKCSHPQAHQAFIKLNKAFKDLQDPEKRKITDEKIRAEEEKERFKAELKEMREAAQWRRLQGISRVGDDELLAEIKLPPTRDEWMTNLPPERKPGVTPTQSTTAFSRNSREGRGDTSMWTDTPLDKAQKAKTNYLEAYNEAAALAASEQNKRTNTDADLVDQYNRAKRSKSLVQKHQEGAGSSRSKKKSKQEKKKGEWEGEHPWKPWDREKDLTAGRQSVNLNAESMVEGLTSRFSSGAIQRNFL